MHSSFCVARDVSSVYRSAHDTHAQAANNPSRSIGLEPVGFRRFRTEIDSKTINIQSNLCLLCVWRMQRVNEIGL
jgi:hypothetical protein